MEAQVSILAAQCRMNSFFTCYCAVIVRSASLTFYPQPPLHPQKNRVNRLDEAEEDVGWLGVYVGTKITCIYPNSSFTALGQ